MQIRGRKVIRLREYDYSSPGEYFVTICTNKKEHLLGEVIKEEVQLSHNGEIVKRHWEDIPNHCENVELDEFIIMPNHIHGIIVLTAPTNDTTTKENDDLIQNYRTVQDEDGKRNQFAE
jgi:REP element-mobilizing transposase RayT